MTHVPQVATSLRADIRAAAWAVTALCFGFAATILVVTDRSVDDLMFVGFTALLWTLAMPLNALMIHHEGWLSIHTERVFRSQVEEGVDVFLREPSTADVNSSQRWTVEADFGNQVVVVSDDTKHLADKGACVPASALTPSA